MSGGTNVSSLERLAALGPVFSVADVQAHFGFDADRAKTYLRRWVAGGLASRFGGGVYFNLVADREGPARRVAEAVDKLLRLPSVVVGGTALNAGGWTTQVHRRLEIAVPVMRGSLTVPATEHGVVLTPRYPSWFRALRASAPAAAPGDIPVASPEMALADALLSGRRSLSSRRQVEAPPPDEIDMGDFGEDAHGRLREAILALGGTEAEADELSAPYADALEDGAGETLSF